MKPKKTIINSNPLTLANLGKGDTIERFDQALAAVLLNIKDEQTGLGKREILIRVAVSPGADRDEADIEVSVITKLAPKPKYASSIVIGVGVRGEIEAHESLPIEEAGTDDLNNDEDNI